MAAHNNRQNRDGDKRASSGGFDLPLTDVTIRAMYDMGLVPAGLQKGCSFEEFRDFVKRDADTFHDAQNQRTDPPREPSQSEASDSCTPQPIEPTLVETPEMIRDFQAAAAEKSKASSSAFQIPYDGEKVPMGSGVTQRVLGKGGMGVVYLIYCKELESYRAVKVLTLNSNDEAHLAARFKTEAKIAVNMHHTNIVQSYLVGEWNNLPFIEMEYIQGNDVAELVNQVGRLPNEVACGIAVNVCRGLVHAHKQPYQLNGQSYRGVVHRDLKPANIRLSETGDVKILDFGIARPATTSIHTIAGRFTGSILYAAPEQIELQEIDFRTDVYSFGLVLHEMLSGRFAFNQPNLSKLLQAKLAGKYTPIEKCAPKIPSQLSRIVDKCLAVDKEDRYASSDILLDAIEDACGRLSRERPEAIVQDWADNLQYDKVRPRGITTRINPIFWLKRLRIR
jgi:tRNA A-37 threonylcarbamoyl transferase component Bud32